MDAQSSLGLLNRVRRPYHCRVDRPQNRWPGLRFPNQHFTELPMSTSQFMQHLTRRRWLTGVLSVTLLAGVLFAADEVLKPGTDKPKDAVVLFDGSNTDAWDPGDWSIKDGAMVSDKHDIATKQKFKDYQLHLEFNEPDLGPEFKGQDRGNSGVYQQGRYELQVLDSYKNETYADGACAAVYGIKAPSKNMAKPPG